MFTLGIWTLESVRGISKMNFVYTVFSAVSGLLADHQDMHFLSLMIEGMHLMQFMPWMEKMAGVLSFLIIPRVVVVVEEGVGVEVRT